VVDGREKPSGEISQQSTTPNQQGGEMKNPQPCKVNKQPFTVGRPEADVMPEVESEDGYKRETEKGPYSSTLLKKLANENR